jgi:PPOX class probable FMN-dependent enzyme
MTELRPDQCVTTAEELDAIYGAVAQPAIIKEVDHIHPIYRPFIEASPLAILATAGPGGLNATARGDPAGFIHIEDEHTLILPDRRGNNRVDSLRNIVADPRVALLFFIPGVGETLRVNGTAQIVVCPEYLDRFAVSGKPPKTVLRIAVKSVLFQCMRAVMRSEIWKQESQVDRNSLPSVGTILRTLSQATIDAEAYDQSAPQRLADTLY